MKVKMHQSMGLLVGLQHQDETFKIIYTAKLSTLSKITPTTITEELNITKIRIQKGSSSQGGAGSYIESGSIQIFLTR